MEKITPKKLEEFRVVKITYEHTIKELEKFEMRLEDEERETINSVYRKISCSIRKRNNLVDWFWATLDEIDSITDILDEHQVRYKVTDHTTTYYRSPEKLSTLREDIDKFMSEIVDTDFVLDRISSIGIENISKFEKKYIEKQANDEEKRN